MEFRILGPLEVSSDGETLDPGGPKQKALLALLLLEANRVVARDRLIDALWEEKPPETAAKALHVYVSQLRKVLGKERLETRAPGYVLRLDPDELDAEQFSRLQEDGRFDEALALWRGPALSDFRLQRFAQTEIARLEETRLTCLESRIEQDLEAGRHVDLVSELERLVAEHPLRERLRRQLMLALYRSGRQADALEVYQQGRAALVEELGIEPGRPLRDLQQAILNQDPSIDVWSAHGTATVPAHPRPRGTVTLFFADVEGSTRLVHVLGGERYRDVRKRARELVRKAASTHAGHEVDWAGDGVFLAFERARDAVAAAVELQRALGAEPWESDEALRMRIGIHTGEPETTDEGYVGIDVHVAARMCAAAHGGQVVVSRAAREFVGDAGEVSFRPLGSHRLRDVDAPQQLFQLVAPGLDETFPPLQTLAGATLPALHHRLVGRSESLEQVEALVRHADVRLVTITGPGGAGKSRLALEVAAAAAVDRPVHLVGLAPVSDPDLVPAAIARTLGVRESPERSLVDALAEALAETGALLFLDNLEHLAPAARHVAELLHRTPGLDVLTTSRAPLRLSGEHVIPLNPLEVDDAATLFFELAAARGIVLREDALPSVHAICRRLDGLPLAIELVAARLAVLPPARILLALDEGLALDMEGPIDLPERQRTLRATIDWSYRLLKDSQRELLGALAVFAGGCTLDDAQTVARSGSTFLADLEALVGWSLVRSDVSDGDVRLSLLETVRENALARLAEQGALEELRRRHAERFLELAATAEEELAGPAQREWLDRLELELDNIRAALDWCFASGRVEDALRAISSLERFWRAHGHVSEARRWLSLGLGLAEGVAREVRADALWTAAQQAAAQSDWTAAEPMLEEARALFRAAGMTREEILALANLSFVARVRSYVDRAEHLAREAVELARTLGDDRALSGALMALGDVQSARGHHDLALEQYEEVIILRHRHGDPLLISDAIYNFGLAAFSGGDRVRARQSFEEALTLARELHEEPYIAAAQFMLAVLDLEEGTRASALERAHESFAVYTDLEDERSRARCLVVCAGAAAADESYEDAARLLGAAAELRGGDDPDAFETPILERLAVELEPRLDRRTLAELEAEGARRGATVLGSGIVTAATRE
jgi:predicted ATPase/DNA-binding SARP family transcriptional activator